MRNGAGITSIEIDDYIERCENLTDRFREVTDRANHVAYMRIGDSESICETVDYLNQLTGEAKAMRKDLRMVSFGTVEMSDAEVRGYFDKIEDLEYEYDCIREDVIQEAKKVLRVL